MDGILKFVYAMFLSLILFLVVIDVHACNVDHDCPQWYCFRPDVMKCIFETCYCGSGNYSKLLL
ncbi:putative Late nodulin [Medicago truncatula]|uniref:Putative Late nodulin n=1 Tax=Medicago truncatula TaxID=3880 RepID=A0A396JBY3_MEDTR|nr:putative Late nodulin [Medicago truncatula]